MHVGISCDDSCHTSDDAQSTHDECGDRRLQACGEVCSGKGQNLNDVTCHRHRAHLPQCHAWALPLTLFGVFAPPRCLVLLSPSFIAGLLPAPRTSSSYTVRLALRCAEFLPPGDGTPFRINKPLLEDVVEDVLEVEELRGIINVDELRGHLFAHLKVDEGAAGIADFDELHGHLFVLLEVEEVRGIIDVDEPRGHLFALLEVEEGAALLISMSCTVTCLSSSRSKRCAALLTSMSCVITCCTTCNPSYQP